MEPTARWTWRLMHRPLINNAHSDWLIHHTHTLCGPTRRCSRPPSAREILAILTLSDTARRAAAKRQSVRRQRRLVGSSFT